MSAMIEVYVILVRAGRRTLEQVPSNLRDAVATRLAEIEAEEGGN